MFNKLSFRQKNRFLYAAMALIALAAYQFAFKRTIDSYILNKDLKRQSTAAGRLPSGVINQDTWQRLNIIIEKYAVDSAEWENDFWFTVSDIAENRNIAVVYERDKEARSDSLYIIKKQVQFSGGYTGLIQLLDSLETDTRAGYLAAVELKIFEGGSSDKATAILAKSEFRVIKKSR